MMLFTLLLINLSTFSHGWREYRIFECFSVQHDFQSIFNGSVKFDVEKCYGSEVSSFYDACRTELINGMLYSGCMNASDWQHNFLCTPTRKRREYFDDMDGLGIKIFDHTKAWCCHEPLCNNLKFFRLLKGAEERKEVKVAEQHLSNMVVVAFSIFIVILVSFIEVLRIKPLYGRVISDRYDDGAV
ncbi:unnamed protein product [Caenorhabditis sp. 36 PRJEB53466]|nr:unnamed protein product [Caenorhabditis sp. 36 PRJEB53466]